MYKLFLTFRYLTRKKIVIFPVLVVWLCVMMLIIVTSIMGGFVERVRSANRELLGDIIISSGVSTRGFSGYDDLRKELQAKVPEIDATTPVVQAFSILYAPSTGQSWPALLVGVNPADREKVTRFRETLFYEYEAPTQAVEDLSKRLPATKEELETYANQRAQQARQKKQDAGLRWQEVTNEYLRTGTVTAHPNYAWSAGFPIVLILLILLFIRARRRREVWPYFAAVIIPMVGLAIVLLGMFWPVMFPRQYNLASDRYDSAEFDERRALRTLYLAGALPPGTYKTAAELTNVLVTKHATFDVPKYLTNPPSTQIAAKPSDGCIVGSQIMAPRDKRGNFVHSTDPIFPAVTVTVPARFKSGQIDTRVENAQSQKFTVIDDSHTGVYDVDSMNVYAPFEIAQQMAGMAPDPELVKQDPSAAFAPRCHDLLIKLKPEAEENIRAVREKINHFVDEWMASYSLTHPEFNAETLSVQTWDEKQARYLGAVENEKVMMTFILLLMSGVVIVVIFLIFYQIVRDKTRDIGIIKAVGGSEEGVAGIFLTYGLFVGVVGGGLGILTGALFVTHTNEIHEFIYQSTGIIIWDRSVYLFDRIPDVVYTSDMITYFVVALVAGVVGSLIPALIAGAEDPVQAVRYE